MGKYAFFFFFQAEDGIRDLYVTGVQTCALPIWTGGLVAAQELRPARVEPHVRDVGVQAQGIAVPDVHERAGQDGAAPAREARDAEGEAQRDAQLQRAVARVAADVGAV